MQFVHRRARDTHRLHGRDELWVAEVQDMQDVHRRR